MFVSSECKALLFRQNLLAGRLEKAENGYLIFAVLTIYKRNQKYFFFWKCFNYIRCLDLVDMWWQRTTEFLKTSQSRSKRTFLAALLKTNFINTYFASAESKTYICIKLKFPSAPTKTVGATYLLPLQAACSSKTK